MRLGRKVMPPLVLCFNERLYDGKGLKITNCESYCVVTVEVLHSCCVPANGGLQVSTSCPFHYGIQEGKVVALI